MKPFPFARQASSTFVTNKHSGTNKFVQIGQAIVIIRSIKILLQRELAVVRLRQRREAYLMFFSHSIRLNLICPSELNLTGNLSNLCGQRLVSSRFFFGHKHLAPSGADCPIALVATKRLSLDRIARTGLPPDRMLGGTASNYRPTGPRRR
jgi:hypothetical protein